jgi:hypothetical protein
LTGVAGEVPAAWQLLVPPNRQVKRSRHDTSPACDDATRISGMESRQGWLESRHGLLENRQGLLERFVMDIYDKLQKSGG